MEDGAPPGGPVGEDELIGEVLLSSTDLITL